jgi:hypothetical protein
MTVMNTNPQGGASLHKGEIELMQNRRLFFDDGKGVNEALNETNEAGMGIIVPSKYFVEVFNTKKQFSR